MSLPRSDSEFLAFTARDVTRHWRDWARMNAAKLYVSLAFAAPELGRRLYANLGPAAGQDDLEVMAIIWNAQ